VKEERKDGRKRGRTEGWIERKKNEGRKGRKEKEGRKWRNEKEESWGWGSEEKDRKRPPPYHETKRWKEGERMGGTERKRVKGRKCEEVKLDPTSECGGIHMG
jgi:hypothetical protein